MWDDQIFKDPFEISQKVDTSKCKGPMVRVTREQWSVAIYVLA